MEDINKDIEILEKVEPYGIIKQNQYDFVNKELYIQAQKNLIKAYKELEEENRNLKENQIIKNEKIRNGQPVILNTRLTVLDVLYLMTEFIKRHEEEFRKDYVDININQIISAIDYFIDNSIPVSLVEEKIEELKKEGNYKTLENPNGRVHFQLEPCDFKIKVLQELLEKRK